MNSIQTFVFIISVLIGRTFAQNTVNVEGLGTIEGTSVSADSVREFLGVPYAEPPVGDLRFARPKPKTAWENVWDATAFGAACPQTEPDPAVNDLVINEDCLFLNIIVPPEANRTNTVPVMIFIPGRGYRVNAGSEYDGHELAEMGIIVVTINYRLFTFGFFSTDDDYLPGNYGLWDQRLAIEWVRRNIGAFGGDSSMITIAGQGRECATQLFSPLNSNGTFQRAIIQSSQFTDISYIMSSEQAKRLSNRLADILNCNQTTWRGRLVCLRKQSWEDVLAASDRSLLGGYFEHRIDGYFFPEPLENLLEGEQVLQYDVLAGVNSDEGITLMHGYRNEIDEVFQTVSDVNGYILNEFGGRYGDEERARLVVNAMEQKYQDPLVGLPDRDSALRYIFDIFGDGFYISNLVEFLRRHQMGAETNTFMYYFDFVGDSDYTLFSDPPRDLVRAAQGEELFYIWDKIFGRNSSRFAQDGTASKILRGNMLQYWVNFVKTGDPNTVGSYVWPQFNEDTESYLWITNTVADYFATGQNLKSEYTSFWLDYIPELTETDDAEQCSQDAPASDTLRGDGEDTEREFVVLNITNGSSELGQVRGILRKADEGIGGKEIRNFRGIPYTLPPVGARRFKYSEVLSDWGVDSSRNATEPSPGCPQAPSIVLAAAEYNEDCLYLNIFAPAIPDDGEKLPVIVYVHFGQYIGGNGVVFDGTALASYGDAVVVTLNYRVGPLGFLSTGDDAAPGNYGIMDVVTALRWIQSYIGSFGGDAGNVTALGMGSGSAIIHMISLNGLNDGLMHKMILLGDSVLSPTLLTSSARDPLQFAVQLANALDCPTESTTELISCLQTKTSDEIIQTPISGSNLFQVSFPPVWDGTLLKDSPDEILASGNYETLPTILGATETDNSIVTALYLNASVVNECPDERFAGAIIDEVVAIFYDGKAEFADLLKMFYLKSALSPTGPSDCPAGQQISELLSDTWLNIPHFEVGRLMARFDKEVYLYFLTFYPEEHVYQVFLPPWVKTCFGDDMPYAFGWPYDREAIEQHGIDFNSNDRKVAINFMEMISSFAKTGIPSANPTDPDSVWEPFDPLKYNALLLDVCPTQEPIPRAAEKDVLWNTLIPELIEALYDDGEEPTPTTMPCMVGSFIGLELTAEEAGRIIGALIITFAVIAAVVVLGIVMKVCVKMSRKSSANKPV